MRYSPAALLSLNVWSIVSTIPSVDHFLTYPMTRHTPKHHIGNLNFVVLRANHGLHRHSGCFHSKSIISFWLNPASYSLAPGARFSTSFVVVFHPKGSRNSKDRPENGTSEVYTITNVVDKYNFFLLSPRIG